MMEKVLGEEVRRVEEVVRQLLPRSALLHNCLMLSSSQVSFNLVMILNQSFGMRTNSSQF